MAKPRKKSNATLEELSSIELAKIGLTLAAIGDVIGYLSIVKAEEEERLRAAEKNSRS
ncbi:hypothetical protein ACK8P5_13595 [Paenibacillus sp. EC2-1]|uniref:hypothetical protein n=1 Tax=Paenibacillus sp. EC2-1 TaxID=3388665 RepID=UPI003BEEF031